MGENDDTQNRRLRRQDSRSASNFSIALGELAGSFSAHRDEFQRHRKEFMEHTESDRKSFDLVRQSMEKSDLDRQVLKDKVDSLMEMKDLLSPLKAFRTGWGKFKTAASVILLAVIGALISRYIGDKFFHSPPTPSVSTARP